MKKIWKGLLQRSKVLSIVFSAITIACLTTILAMNLTTQLDDPEPDHGGDNVSLTHGKTYYDNLGIIEAPYLQYTTYTAATAPDGKTAGTWLTGIDVSSMTGGIGSYIGAGNYVSGQHRALVIPHPSDTTTKVVGIDLATNGYMNASAIQYLQAVALIEKVVIPDTVQYITEASFFGFSKLGYFETPFIGTERGSSGKGMDLDITEILGVSTPTSDSFGAMFSLPNPNLSASSWTSGTTDYWTFDPTVSITGNSSIDSVYYQPRNYKWREHDDGVSKSDFFTYQIPDKIDYLYITDETRIGNYALNNCSAKHVEITASSSVKDDCFVFGNYALAESGKLPDATIGEKATDTGLGGLEEIKLHMKGFIDFRTGTFDKCELLKKLTVPYVSSNLTIPEAFLNQALSLEEVFIPGTVTSIGDGAFKGCEKLNRISVYTGDSENLAEDYDTDLAAGRVVNSSYQFYFPNGLKTIGMEAFSGCKSLTTIYVPNTVTQIGYSAYGGCTKVTKAILPFVGAHAGNISSCNTLNCTDSAKDGPSGKKTQHGLFGWIFGNSAGDDQCYKARQQYIDTSTSGNPVATATFTIPNTLSEVTITNETHLTKGCFQGLSSLTSVTINDAVSKNIELGCFDQCGKLEMLSIPYIVGGNLGALFQGTDTFDGSISTTGNNYRVPSTLTNVRVTNMPNASGALFHECQNIKTVEFSDRTTNFGHGIFHNNQSLETLVVPVLGECRGEFYRDYWWWRDKRYRNNLMWLFSEDYQTGTYRNTSQLYYDRYYAAYIPSTLKHVTVTNESCFGEYSFQGFTSLTSISITNTPDYIAEYSFWNCGSLNSLQLPYIGYDINKNGYSGRSHVLGWIFGRSNYGNAYAATQAGTTYYIPNGLETVEIGTSSTAQSNLSNKIFDDAFRDCKSIVTVDFNIAVIDALGNGAFANCTKLNELIYPNARYTHVGNSAFLNCKNVKRMKSQGEGKKGFIPDTVKTIGSYGFAGTSVAYKDTGEFVDNELDLTSYTSLGDYAFSNCLQIKSVEMPNNVEYVGTGLFADCSYLADVNLINKNVSPYMFKNCVSLEGIDFRGINDIPDGVFQGCTNLSFAGGLQLDPTIYTIGDYSFAGCQSLESDLGSGNRFELPPTLKSIGKGAFQQCKSLDHMTIPKETTVIDPEGWVGCDDNFYFWVYNREEKWPKTWVTNWNCDYPVYVLGDDSEEIFTYSYRMDERKYYITGITKEAYDAGLSGIIRIPASHNGVAVVGINEEWQEADDIAAGAKKIGSQQDITGIILPKGVTKIYGSPFQNNARVDIYTEYTEAEILKIYEESKKAAEDAYVAWENTQTNPSDTDKQNKIRELYGKIKGWKPYQANSDGIAIAPTETEDFWDVRNWTSGGMLYYYDYWRYGTGVSATVPFLRVEKLKFTFDEYSLLDATFTGSEIEVPVVQIQLPGEVFLNDSIDLTIENLMYVYEWDVDIMNYDYSNNVNVGTANVKVTVNNTRLDNFNASYPEKERYPLRLLGQTTLHYQIQPIEIVLTATANEGLYYEKTYDGSPFSYYQWQSGQITGLEGFNGAVFSGTIATPSANANNAGHPEYMGSELVWTTPWRVLLNNIDVSKNFRVTVLFSVIIDPMEVELVWAISDEPVDGVYQTAELEGKHTSGKDVYLYPYIGGKIYPKAIAKKYGSDTDYVPDCKMYVTIPGTVGVYPYTKTPDYYYMYGGITSACSNNYVLVAEDDSGNKYYPEITTGSSTKVKAVDAYYKIVNGRVVIEFDLTYTLSPTEDRWSFTWGVNETGTGVYDPVDTRTYIKGLGTNSRFVGELATSGDAKSPYAYPTSGGAPFEASGIGVYLLSWQTVSFGYSGTATDGSGQTYTVNFTADADSPYRIWNPVLGLANENEYYDVEVRARVDIKYNTFNPTWFIGLNGADYELIKNPDYILAPDEIHKRPTQDIDGLLSEREYYYWKYEVDGQEYRFSAEDLDVLKNAYPNYEVLYYAGNGTTLDDQDVTFTELGNHVFSVTLRARHYDTIQYNIWIEAVKSHVKIDSLTKVYDREPVDLLSCIKKIGDDQRANIQVTYMDQYGTPLVEQPPVNVGKYKAHIVIPEGTYFHAYDEVLDFDILPRPIYIDVTTGPAGAFKTFDNSEYQIDVSALDLSTSAANPNSGLLSGDVMQGFLQTSSFIPGIYDTQNIYDSNATGGNFAFRWGADWSVTYVGTFEDVSKNYEVILQNSFEIKPLEFIYNVYDESSNLITDTDAEGHLIKNLEFDSKIHYIRVDVSYPMPGNYFPAPTPTRQIVYSDQPLSENSTQWLNASPTCVTPGEYKIYYMIKADYFETIIDYVTVNITELLIEYTDPATSDGDGFDSVWTVEYDGAYHDYEIVVTKPSFSATVYYSVDGGAETPAIPSFKEPGEYAVKYRITAPNYEEVEKEVTVRIVQPGDPIPEEKFTTNFFNGVYDENPHSAIGQFDSSWVASQPTGFWTHVLYSIDEGEDWTEFPFEYTEIGTYPVWIKFQAKGYQDQIVKGEIVIKGKPLSLTTSPVNITFDNKYHNVNLVATGTATVTQDPKTGVWTYTDSTCPSGVELKLSYSLDANVAHADSGWLTGDGYKDVGTYPIYLKVEGENFEPLIFENYTELRINFLENPTATMDSPQIFEYSKSPLDVSQLEIDTVADGARTAYWYAAHKKPDGTYEQDLPAEPTTAPQELGVYYVEVRISPSKNTGKVTVSGFVEIVPRKLTVKWDSPQYYDGTLKNPNAYVETGTSDSISLLYSVQGSSQPIDVGSYVFDVSMANPNPNYVLDRSTFTLEIIKRNILFKLDEEHVIKDGYAKWVETDSESYDTSSQCPGDDHWHLLGDLHGTAEKWDSTKGEYVETEYAGLAPNHMIYVRLETSAGVRGEYHYSTITNNFFINSVKILDWDIYEKDGNGNIITNGGVPVSVKEYYDVDFDIVVNLTNPKIDLNNLEMITEYVYDGLPHAIYFNVPTSYGGAYIYYKDDTNRWTTTPLRRTFVGEYTVEYYVGATGYEDTYGTATLKITPADLNIEIGNMYKKGDTTKSLHEKYDDTAHLNTYTVTNLKCDPIPEATHIRYYDATTCTQDDVFDLYRNFSESSALYQSGIPEMIDAGKYYCVVYYEEDTNRWHKSFAVKEVELLPRNIIIEFPAGSMADIYVTYNGNPVVLPLTNAIIDTTLSSDGLDGLLAKHTLATTPDKLAQYFVQTNSANAGVYPLDTGFEFLAIDIKEANSGKQVKISNYHPVLRGDFHVEILKKYLEDYEFYLLAQEYIKEYDGKIHNTNYFADGDYFCASDGEQLLTFTELLSGGGTVSCVGPQKNAGVYEVVLAIDEGTNYYSSYASAAAYKSGGIPFLSYPTVKYKVTCTPKVVDVTWDKLEQRFNGEVLAPVASFVDAETDPKNPVDVQLKITYFDNDAKAFIAKNIVNAGTYLALAGFDTTTAKGKEYAKNYHLQTSTLSETFIVDKLTLTLQLGDGGESNKITYYSSSSPWWTYVYKTPTANAAEFLADGDDEAQAWIDKMVISSLTSDDGIPTISTTVDGGDICRTYSDYYDFDYNIRIKTPSGLDVTDSIEYRIKDNVTILPDEIVYTLTTPIEVLYREAKGDSGATGYNLAELNCLSVKNPKKYSIDNYRIDGKVASTTDRITNAGEYTLTFDITAPNYTPCSVEVTVKILQRSSYMIFTKDLTKVYDASPVDASTLVNMNLSGFNGEKSDLVFTYYEIPSTGPDILLTEAPTNVGNYRVHVVSNADTDPSVQKNYTTLEIDRTFSITPKPIDLVFELDLELEDDSKLGFAWDYEKSALAGDVPGVFSGDKMQYAFHLDSLLRGEYVGKKSFLLSNGYTQQNFTTDGGTIFQFAWVVYDANDDGTLKTQDVLVPDPSNPGSFITVAQPIDISENYQVNLSFKFIVHYPYIPFEIEGVETPYDGANHSGTIKFSDDNKGVHNAAWYQANVDQFYSESADNLETSTINSINHPNISKSEPGTYTIYYLLKVKSGVTEKYEEARGSFVIKINKLDRELTVVSPTKDYDGSPAGTQYTGSTTTRWMPDHTIAPRAYPDNFDYDDVEIRYLLGKKEVSALDGCIESGTYSYSIKIPATKYYNETLANGIFYINRIKLYIADDTLGAGPASYPYNAMVKTFDFNYNHSTLQQNPQSNYILYTMNGGTQELLSTNNLLFRAQLVTNSKEVGTYRGSDGTLTVFAYEYEVYDAFNGVDATNNYILDIANASIIIENLEMQWSTEEAVYIYDGKLHDFDITFTSPSREKVTIQYFDGKVWQETPIRYVDCGTYECDVRFIADNYTTVETTVKMTIKRAPTEVLYVTGLGKTYDGAEVTLPEQIFTNRDLADEDNLRNTYTYEYFRYDPTTDTYSSVPMFTQTPVYNPDGSVTTQHTGTRPIDVGQYKIRIHLPAVQNFEAATYESNFIIGQRETTVNWVGASFVYDGTPKCPEAFMKLTAEDIKNGVVVKLKYTVVPNGAPNDTTHTAAGFYTAKLEIDYDNSSPKAQNYKIDFASESYPFKITKRPIEIKFSKRGVLDDDALHQYRIKHDLSTEVNPSTSHLFTINNLVTGHVMKDYLEVVYDGARIYNTVDDFEWHNFLTDNGLLSPRIFDALGNEVQDNYIVMAYSYLFELTTDASALQRELIPYSGEYDGNPHTFTFNLIGADKNDYLISYRITVLSGGNGVTGTGNHFVMSTNYPAPDHQPLFTPVGEYLIEVKIANLSGTEICIDPVTVTITQADPGFKLANPDNTLTKVYDGIPVENPEMDYKDKAAGDDLVRYTYYAYNTVSGDYDIQLATAPKTVGQYKLKIEFLGNNNYKPVTYPDTAFEIQPRKITITVPPIDSVSKKKFDYTPWTTPILDTYVNPYSPSENLALNQTLFNPILSSYPNLVLKKIDAGKYRYIDYPTEFYFSDTSTSKCKIFDEYGQEVQDNYVFDIQAEVTIEQREFVYDFEPLISKFEAGNSYYVAVKILGTLEDDGSTGPIYVNSSEIQILYSLTSDFTTTSATPIPLTQDGHYVVWAKITAGNNYKPILTYAPVYLYKDDGTDPDDEPLPDNPHDADDDPDVEFDKDKVYDGKQYAVKYNGHQANDRNKNIVYYTYEYYKDCKDNSLPLDPSKAIIAPTNVGTYVFVLDVDASPDGTDPAHHYEQVFRIKPRPVAVEWEGLIAYIETGKTQLDVPTYPKAKYQQVNGTYKYISVGPDSGQVAEGVYIVSASDPVPDPNYKLTNLNEVFEITANHDKTPKPGDAEDRDDIDFTPTKVYDTVPYPDPIFTGNNAAKRVPTIEYYDWKYYNDNNGVINTADQLGTAPTNAGAYVFIMHIPADPDDPLSVAEEVRQYFTITPKEVTVTWGPLTFVHDGTEKKPTATFQDIPGNTINCNVTPGYDYVGKDLPVMALSPDPNYMVTNPHATITITGTEIDPVIIAPGQEIDYLDPIILQTTDSDPDYYISKEDYDADNTIIPISDWSKAFLVDNNGVIYKWDTSTTTWVDDNRPYTMKFDVNRDAGTHTVTTSLKDKTQTSWKGLTSADLTEDYEIKPLDVKNSTKYDIEYSYKTIWPYDNGKEIQPPVEIILRDRLVPTHTIKLVSPKDFTLSYKNNIEPTDKAEILIQGTGNYTFGETKYFTIVKNMKLLELNTDADAAWITAIIDENGEAVITGEDDGTDPVAHDKIDQPDMYLGRLHQETTIEDVLKQFVGYDTHPEEFIVKKRAETPSELADPDIDVEGFIPIPSADYAATYFANGMKVCLQQDQGDGTMKVVDEVVAILHGDVNNDGVVNLADLGSVGAYIKEKKEFNQVTKEYFFSGIVNRDVPVINLSTIAKIGAFTKDKTNDFNEFGTVYTGFYTES